MGGGARDFQAVLEGVLGGAAPASAPFGRSCIANTPDPGLLLSLLRAVSTGLEARGSARWEATGLRGWYRSPGPSRPAAAAPVHVPPPRPLTPAQRVALDHLREAGAASLDHSFTPDTLKQAFRQLALRYHPDRHPGCTDRERRRLAATFASVHDAYRTLLGAASRVH